jgi:hypothetical protein
VKFTDLEFLRSFPEVRHFQADYMSRLEAMGGLLIPARRSGVTGPG